MQQIHTPSESDIAEVHAKRDWVRNHYEPATRHRYETVEGKLRLLDTILSSDWIEPTEILKLQCLGITFGDALAQELGMTWVVVEDEHGRDPALTFVDSKVLAFPLTSLSKRVERGEVVNVYELFAAARTTLIEARRGEA